jgi:hypothetical protein
LVCGERERFGQGVQQLPEREPVKECGELGRRFDRCRGHVLVAGGVHELLLTTKSLVSRTNREAVAGAGVVAGHGLDQTAFQHALDQADVDRFGLQSAAAGVVDGLGVVSAEEAKQPVDLPHLGPGQGVVQSCGGVGAHVRSVRGCRAVQRIQVTGRRGGQLGRQVCGVGVAAPGPTTGGP